MKTIPDTIDDISASRFLFRVRKTGNNVIQIGGNNREGSYGEDVMFRGTGNVGINTEYPQYPLHVVGGRTFNDNSKWISSI